MLGCIHDDSIAIFIVYVSLHQLLNGQLAKLPAILDSLLNDIANATSIPIGVEGWWWWGVTKW